METLCVLIVCTISTMMILLGPFVSLAVSKFNYLAWMKGKIERNAVGKNRKGSFFWFGKKVEAPVGN